MFYALYDSIEDTLRYDFAQERVFDYAGLSTIDVAYHFAHFVSGVWQIHPFGEGNTCTTAVIEALNHINRYQRDSFWSGCGLFECVQLFVISNGTLTKYYSNTTRFRHAKAPAGRRQTRRKTSDSYEFTSYWADARNKVIVDLTQFARTFLERRTLMNVLTKYCVLTDENLLLAMKP